MIPAATENYRDLENAQADGKQHWIRWIPVRGLNLAMTPLGSKSWLVRGTLKTPGTRKGTPIVFTLPQPWGSKLDLVEEAARNVRTQIKSGIDPRIKIVPPKELTLAEVWDEFKVKHLAEKNSPAHQEYMERDWRLRVGPTFGHLPVKAIESPEVNRFLDSLSKPTANKTQSLISMLWKFGHNYWPRDCHTNPCAMRSKHVIPERDRHLEVHECKAFAKAFLASGRTDKWLLMFSLLTSARDGVPLHFCGPEFRKDPGYLLFPKGLSGVKGARFLVLRRYAETDHFCS